jgi:hypothetical protein
MGDNMGRPVIDLKDKKFGTRTVIGLNRMENNVAYWDWTCDCGDTGISAGGDIKRTMTCTNVTHHPTTPIQSKSPKWKGYGEVSATYFNRCKANANARKLEFSITIEYVWCLFLKQKRKCALSGMPLQFQSKSWLTDGNASLDRIDSSVGYVEGNVQWVDKDINEMKWGKSDDYFIELCKRVSNHNAIHS